MWRSSVINKIKNGRPTHQPALFKWWANPVSFGQANGKLGQNGPGWHVLPLFTCNEYRK